jgi:hypothetical protein
MPRRLLVFACPSTEADKIFLSIDACYLYKCNHRDGSLEEIINKPFEVLYDLRNGTKFTVCRITAAYQTIVVIKSDRIMCDQ